MKKFLFVALALFALCGCEKKIIYKGYDGSIILPYVSVYVLPTEIEVIKDCVNDYGVFPYIHFKGKTQHTSGDDIPDEIKELRSIYGDTTRYRKDGGVRHIALAYPIDEITISCDQDFDSRHPAGEPLDDIVLLDYGTYYPFIQNGYNGISLTRYTICFNCVNANTTKLISYSRNLDFYEGRTPAIKFRTKPDVPGEYTFNLAVDMNGETLTTSFTYTFE